ncbi:MAG: AraC family transcriptional regulator [Candidimonas sp.]|nr:MAG: AraC family transcriptional regulator [Candidimonas sp.]
MLLQEGSVELHDEDGAVTRIESGSLVVINPAHGEFYWSDSREVHLLLARDRVIQAMGVGVEFFGPVALLDHSPLAPFICSQMVLLDRQAGSLGQLELANMLDITVEMALMLLRSNSKCASEGCNDFRRTVFTDALRVMQEQAHNPDLNAEALASALGCSRAKLYRVFASQGTTVNSVLRDVRLDRARRLIEHSSTGTHIGALAYSCGFSDHSSFGRMFKERFGSTPGEWRLFQKTGQPL